jgi:hypothetical protein
MNFPGKATKCSMIPGLRRAVGTDFCFFQFAMCLGFANMGSVMRAQVKDMLTSGVF